MDFVTDLGKPVVIQDGLDGHMVFGELDLWLRRFAGEWHFAMERNVQDEDRPCHWICEVAPAKLAWERWITGDNSVDVTLRPRPPDRSVVVRPEMAVRLQPGQSTVFFVGLPLWLEALAGPLEKPVTLQEFPSVQLSSSWFGSPQEGELAYAMRTNAHRSPESLLARPHRCICPLQVKNASDEMLAFERVCIRCQHLQVYRGTERFWTNTVRLSYRTGFEDFEQVLDEVERRMPATPRSNTVPKY